MKISYYQFLNEGWVPSASDNPEKKRYDPFQNRYVSAAEKDAAAAVGGRNRSPAPAELEHVARTEHNTSYGLMSREDKIRLYKKVFNRVKRTGRASDIPINTTPPGEQE